MPFTIFDDPEFVSIRREDLLESPEFLRLSEKHYDGKTGGSEFYSMSGGTTGDDTIVAVAGNDTVDGDLGFDTYDLSVNNTAGAFVDLEAGSAFGGTETGIDTLISIEAVRGGSGLD